MQFSVQLMNSLLHADEHIKSSNVSKQSNNINNCSQNLNFFSDQRIKSLECLNPQKRSKLGFYLL